jgi:O-acetyl-ADP-ribose deacetylase (regulator of RNase III)
VKAILRTAEVTGATSLAIPSLGVGNLHFPAQVSAQILFEEIIEFQSKNPGYGMKFHFVVFDQNTYMEFSKEYAQKMSSAVPQKKVSR